MFPLERLESEIYPRIDAWRREKSQRRGLVNGYGLCNRSREKILLLTRAPAPELASELAARLDVSSEAVEVTPVGAITPATRRHKHTPAHPGVNIGPGPGLAAEYGTLGIQVTTGEAGGPELALSSAHLLAPPGVAKGAPVHQPSRAELNTELFGSLLDWEPIVDGATMDAALVEVGDRGIARLIDRQVEVKGHVTMRGLPPDAEIQKHGVATDVTYGTVSGIYAVVDIDYPQGTTTLTKQILSHDLLTNHGDSGASVVRRFSHEFVGIVVGFATSDGAHSASVISAAEVVLERFEVSVV